MVFVAMLAFFLLSFSIFSYIKWYLKWNILHCPSIWTPRSHITTRWNKWLLASDDSHWAVMYMNEILLVLCKLSVGFKWAPQSSYFLFGFFPLIFLTIIGGKSGQLYLLLRVENLWHPVPEGKTLFIIPRSFLDC